MYTASEHALPFPLELCECGDIAQRIGILDVLCAFAFSTDPNDPYYEPLTDYELRIHRRLVESIPLFEQLAFDTNVDLAAAARETINRLNTKQQ